jgi:hypothetical protein
LAISGKHLKRKNYEVKVGDTFGQQTTRRLAGEGETAKNGWQNHPPFQ